MLLPGKQFEFDRLFQGESNGRARRFGQINLYQVGELSCISGYTVPAHKQWCHEISYVISGEGLFTTNNEVDLLVEGDIHIAPANSIHAIETVNNTDLRFGYIGFSFEEDDKLDPDIVRLKEFYTTNTIYKASDHSELIIPVLRNLDELYDQVDFYSLMVETYLIQILVSVFRTFSMQSLHAYFPAVSTESVGRSVYSVIKYIDNNIYDKISVQEIAQKIGYNYSYISNMFKKRTGMTIQHYISNKKIQKAIELMKYGKLSVAQVGQKLDYANVQSFNKAFKRTMGCPPTEFLRNYSETNGVPLINGGE
jgi:AraC-like DNA-binding protein/quercetin dioxygenase-like cupin family protein